MNVIQLTKKLISIPSYLGDTTNEKSIGDFIFKYLCEFPYLNVKKQYIDKNRFNVIAKTKGTPRLLLAGHMDTVEPKQGWKCNQFAGTIKNKKLFGLGSLDTKGGIAAILDALKNFKNVAGLSLLFYCDEEYDLRGMKQFIQKNNYVGELAILAEPTDLKIWNTHKGLIEISFTVQGKTGHAANPEGGKNAITAIMEGIIDLRKKLKKFADPTLGVPSLNIAAIRGGLNLGINKNGERILGRQGNNIADFAEITIDIRPTKIILRANLIKKWISASLKKNGVRLEKFSIRHDFGSLFTERGEIMPVQKSLRTVSIPPRYLDPATRGYGDGQLLQEMYKIPVIYLGPRGKNAHAPNEWADIASIEKLRDVYVKIIASYCV